MESAEIAVAVSEAREYTEAVAVSEAREYTDSCGSFRS